MKKFVLVAGESSGDLVGEDLILALKKHFPDAVFAGIGGPKMIGAGLTSWFDIQTLSVMGLINVLINLPSLLRLYRQLLKKITEFSPDFYIGIDAPDFNLRMEKKLKQRSTSEEKLKGLKIIHYISPSVWAWRYDRVFDIQACTDLILCVLPFEEKIYRKIQHQAVFVGHPLANQISIGFSKLDAMNARKSFNLPLEIPLLAILPGSRVQEVSRLLPVFLDTFAEVKKTLKNAMGILPVAHSGLWKVIRPFADRLKSLGILCVEKQSGQALAACDFALVASGTAALESVLYKKPTVVAYKADFWMYSIGRALVNLPYMALPNLLALWEHQIEGLIPEFLQSEATVENLTSALLHAWKELSTESDEYQQLIERFEQIHRELALNSGELAAQAIRSLC